MAPGDSRDVIERAGEIINDFALAFIAPLRTNHHDRFHSQILLVRTTGPRDLRKTSRRDTRALSAKSARHTNLKSYDGLLRNASDESEWNFRKLKQVAGIAGYQRPRNRRAALNQAALANAQPGGAGVLDSRSGVG